MEIDEEPAGAAASSPRETSQNGLDSDDETLRFDKDDDLYSSDLDEADALWVRKQVRAREWPGHVASANVRYSTTFYKQYRYFSNPVFGPRWGCNWLSIIGSKIIGSKSNERKGRRTLKLSCSLD